VLPEDLLVPASHLRGEDLHDAQRAVLARIDADEREMATVYARQMRHRAEAAQLWAEKSGQGLIELAGTARVGQDKAYGQLVEGIRLQLCFPRALELLETGAMLVGTAQMLLRMTRNLSGELQAQVGDRVCDTVARLDAADARQHLAKAIAEVRDAAAAKAAHEQARAQRGVWVKPVEDGMARIGAEVDQLSARRWALDFEELVRAETLRDARTGRQRTTQQRRADVFAELPSRHLALTQALQQGKGEELRADAEQRWAATAPAPTPEPTPESAPAVAQASDQVLEPVEDSQAATTPAVAQAAPVLTGDELLAALLGIPLRNPVTLHVHVPVTTALDLDNRACTVEGLGVVPAFQARLLRPVASLARLNVDARTGLPLGMDPDPDPPPDPGLDPQASAELVRNRLLAMLRPTAIRDTAEPRHDPSSSLRRLVEVRDVRCDGPGCPMPASRCELDHQQDWADDGPTAIWNLTARSPRCHHAKHDGWTVEHHPDGSSTWTSPTDRSYHRRSAWQPPVLPPTDEHGDITLPPPTPDTLDDTDPREDWHLPLWRSDDPPEY
jgi:hypothetical protein